MSALPKVTINELSKAIEKSTGAVEKVLEGILNDYMDLLHGKTTPFTTGKTVIPTGATIEDVNAAKETESVDKIFRDIFGIISDTHKNGDLTPRSKNDGTWDPKFTPVLVFVTSNP